MATYRISVTPVVYKQNRLKNGSYPIKMRITFRRASSTITTNITASPDQLTRSLNIKDPGLQAIVDKVVNSLQETSRKIPMAELETMTIRDISRYLIDSQTYDEIAEEKFSLDFYKWGEKIASAHRTTSAYNYKSALKALRNFTGKEDLDISAITSSFMRRFENWLKETYGQDARAVSLYTGHVRTMHIQAQREFNNEELNEINIKNPFQYYTPPKQIMGKHRDVNRLVVQRIIDCYQSLTGLERTGAAAFLISFALRGMNTPDLYEVLPPDKRGVLHYYRHKTRDRRADMAETYVKIPKCIKPLMDEWKDPKGERCFSFYHHYGNFINMTTSIDRGLRRLKKRLNMEKSLSMYTSRHSWATQARAYGISAYEINDALSHVTDSLKTTDIYMRKNWNEGFKKNEEFLNKKFNWEPLKKKSTTH